MVSKFKASGCLDDRPCSVRPSTSVNVAWTVQEGMEIVVGSSVHGEVRSSEVVHHSGIPYTAVWVALWCILLCYPFKIQRHHELLPDFCEDESICSVVISKNGGR